MIGDTGAPPPGARRRGAMAGCRRGADRFAHAGTLAFEMSVGRDRLIVNCGAAPAAEEDWRDALRATAAHSTLMLSDTNSSELRPEGLGRRARAGGGRRARKPNGAQWLEASHDGWRAPFGALTAGGCTCPNPATICAARTWWSSDGDGVVPAFALRFHLHPGVAAVLLQDESAALLRLPSGIGWRLRAKGARVALEESIYLGGRAAPQPAGGAVRRGGRGIGAMGDQPRVDGRAWRDRRSVARQAGRNAAAQDAVCAPR